MRSEAVRPAGIRNGGLSLAFRYSSFEKQALFVLQPDRAVSAIIGKRSLMSEMGISRFDSRSLTLHCTAGLCHYAESLAAVTRRDPFEFPEVDRRVPVHKHSKTRIDERFGQSPPIPGSRSQMNIGVCQALVAVLIPVLLRQDTEMQDAAAKRSKIPNRGCSLPPLDVLEYVITDHEIAWPCALVGSH